MAKKTSSQEAQELHETNVSIDIKSEDSAGKARENTRSEIAKFYVYAFFGILLITILIGLFTEFEVEDYRDMLVTVSGILSGPLGFIIGYYFKASTSDD